MSMSLTQNARADQRWAAAQKIADGEMDERMPRRRRIVWLWISALFIVSLLLGIVLSAILPRPTDAAMSDDEGWTARLIAAAVFQAMALVVGVAGVVWAVRTRRFITRWRAVASPLNLRERKWVITQIRSAAPVDDERKRLVVLAVAAQNRRATLGVVPLYCGMTLLAVSVGLSSRWEAIVWIELAVVLSFLVVFLFLARDYRRAGVYLDTFGGQSADAGSAPPGS
jgi:hypothetical protein